MSGGAVIGLDIGTQSLKAVVVDDYLQILGEATAAYRPSFPRPGWAEQDASVWEQALAPAIGKALAAAGVEKTRIAALGICGQLDGCIPVDAAGRAVAPCIIWMDRRAEAELADYPVDRIRAITGVTLDPTHMAAKIRWLKRRHVQAARFHQPVSYLVARLTGADVFDHALASTSMLYDLSARAFSSELLDLFEISTAELPLVAEAFDCAGQLTRTGAALTGLPAGIPVAVGTGDDFSNPLGAGIVDPGKLVCTLGTAEVVGALHCEPVIDTRGLVETHSYAAQRFFIENPGWLSGGALTWFIDTFRLVDAIELDRLAAAVPAGAEGINFFPALSGAMAPEWIASARGGFYGLTPAHGAGHLARALLEGCAFAMRDVLERLQELGVDCSAILLLGGGARSELWARIRADLTGLPVEQPRTTDTSPLGAAMLAGVAAGVHPDLATAARLVEGTARTLEPDPQQRSVYDNAYGAYRRLFECLRPMYAREEAV